jgi:predicted porin
MSASIKLTRGVVAALGLACATGFAHAQVDYSLYGVVDLSYGRFEPSGFDRENRLSSNSLSASFIGVNASYGFEGGWKPGMTLETFLRFEDLDTGRNEDDPFLSRNAFVSLGSPYGRLSIGRHQTLLFDTTSRFNAWATRRGSRPRSGTSSRAATSKACRATSTGIAASLMCRRTGRARPAA